MLKCPLSVPRGAIGRVSAAVQLFHIFATTLTFNAWLIARPARNLGGAFSCNVNGLNGVNG